MKTESLAPKPAAEAQATRGPGRNGKEAPADLFATLLAAAEGEDEGTLALPAANASLNPTTEPVETTASLATDGEPAAEDIMAFAALLPPSVADEPLDATSTTADAAALAAEPAVVSTAITTTAPSLATHPHSANAQTVPSNPPSRGMDKPELGGPGQWVSTVAKARTSKPPPQVLTELIQSMQAATSGQGLSAEPARAAWHAGSTGQVAGALVEQLGNPENMDLSVLGGATAERSGEQGEGGQGQRGDGPRVILESAGQTRAHTETAAAQRSFASLLGDAMGQGMDDAFRELGDQVSLWAAGQTRKASLRLEAGLRETLEVDVSLNGDKAQLVFRTDDAQARDAIKAHAYQILNEMLSQAGLGLDSLSVGGRNAGQSGEPGQEGRHQADSRRNAPDEPAAEPARLLGSRQGVGLSVYA